VNAGSIQSVLELQRARLRVRLGWEAAERARPQAVDLGVRIEFAAPPRACRSDQLGDTVCYAALIERAQQACEGREFRLIEHLAQTLLEAVQALLPAAAAVELTVSKPHAPVPALAGGVRFSLRCEPSATPERDEKEIQR
jgi:7,8-dihydroneopterin aldolase/epimerase/oxygenase